MAGPTPSDPHFLRGWLEYPMPVFEPEYPESESEILSLGAFCRSIRIYAMGAKRLAEWLWFYEQNRSGRYNYGNAPIVYKIGKQRQNCKIVVRARFCSFSRILNPKRISKFSHVCIYSSKAQGLWKLKVHSQVWDNFWQLKALLRWWKMFFISPQKLFSFSRYLRFWHDFLVL